jgi:DNA-binding transcriptional ArsR family regulator
MLLNAMLVRHVLNQSSSLDQLFQALSDPNRRGMVERLGRGPASVSELAIPLKISLPATMQHLEMLEACGLVRSEKKGRVRTCRIDPGALESAELWIKEQHRMWDSRIDQLQMHVEALKSRETQDE